MRPDSNIKGLHTFLWRDPTTNNCNTYFINGEKKILIDPGHYHCFGHVKDHLSTLSLTPGDIDTIIITHGHPDHMEGVRFFTGTDALICIHTVEMDFIREVAPHYGEALGIQGFEPDLLLKEGELEIGDMAFRVIHTPGHSPGSICLYLPDKKLLFTGDVVFNKSLGRTDLPGGSGKQLKESIRILSRLDVEHVMPGHGETISGKGLVRANFAEIERRWFAYI